MARAKKPGGEIEAFRAALGAARGKTARSALYRWLRANHDQFLEDWTEAADWPAFVQAFSALGLTDRTGKPPVPETARKTWATVRKDIAKAKARKEARRAPTLAPGEIAPGVRALQPLAPASDDAPLPPITLDVRPSRPRMEAPAPETASSPSQPLAPAPEAPPRRISGQISKGQPLTDAELEVDKRRLRSAMRANTAPIPKPI